MGDATILVTGSEGLIGTVLVQRLAASGFGPIGIDTRSARPERRIDIGATSRLAPLIAKADGIVHLAAVSRVIDGELDPERCRAVNVDATRALLAAALAAPHPPWFIYASSREVYGQQDRMPVFEDAPYRPLNTYARSKVDAEQLCAEARAAGLATAVVRFSSVYGSAADHATRVVPAFVSAALRGATLRVDGAECTFDLTHVDDVADGLVRVIALLQAGETALPPIHFASGKGIRLLDLATQAIEIGGNRADLVVATPRSFDITSFIGDTARAEQLLAWRATTELDAGLRRLAADFTAEEA